MGTSNVLAKLHVLEHIYQEGYHSQLLEQTLNKIFDVERSQALQESYELHQQLQIFEQRYHISSEEFYRRFHAGELGDQADYFEWSAYCNMYNSVKKRLYELAA